MEKPSELLQAMLRNDIDATSELSEQISEDDWKGRYGDVLNAAFYMAANRRFRDQSMEAILSWVGSLRARLGEDADEVDPRYAEWLIRGATRNEVELLEKIAPDAYVPLQLLLTAQLVSQEDLTETDLPSFLSDAETLATAWESQR